MAVVCTRCTRDFPSKAAMHGHLAHCEAAEPAPAAAPAAAQPAAPPAAERALPAPVEPPPQPAWRPAPSGTANLCYIDRFPLPPEPEFPACRLDQLRGMPPWRDPLDREPDELPGGKPPPAPPSSPGAGPGTGEPQPGDEPEPKPAATAGVSWGDTIADVGDAMFPDDPVKPAHRKLLRAKFKTEIDETQSAASILVVIFGPKLWRSDAGQAMRAWIWEHSVGLLKRWFRWPWWGGPAAQGATEDTRRAEPQPGRAASDAVIDAEVVPNEEPAPRKPAPPPRAVAAAAAAAATTVTPEEIGRI